VKFTIKYCLIPAALLALLNDPETIFPWPGPNGATAVSRIPQNNTAMELTLLSLNAWASGTNVKNGQNKVLNAILRSGADIVGLSESTEIFGKAVAEKLNWHLAASGDNSIISRYPINKSWHSTRGTGAEIILVNDRKIAVESVHLTAYPYGPYSACLEGATQGRILSEETTSGRVAEMTAVLQSIDSYLKDGTPTFLMGDLNSPSHMDWTDETKVQHCGYSLQWPVTLKVEQAGMADAYRQMHPDPASHPGITWSPIYLDYRYGDGKPEPLDRIDFVFFKGENVQLHHADALVFGASGQYLSHMQNEWPSDHAAVLASFMVETGAGIGTGPLARFYASTASVTEGETVQFSDNSSNSPTKWSWTFEGGTPDQSSEQNPSVIYSAAGHFSITLIAANAEGSDTASVTDLIKVERTTTQARLVLDKQVYAIGEPIEATFSNGPGNPTDWVGIYKPGDTPGPVPSTLWLYVNGTQTANEALENGWVTFDPGLSEAGSWWAGFFANDGYELLDSLSFTVGDPSGIKEDASAGMPETLSLYNYPNPFNSGTTIAFTLPEDGEVSLKIIDILGEVKATPVHVRMSKGKHAIRFKGEGLASGIYHYTLRSGRRAISHSMLLLK
jgi:PKD repeat protein/endonuclease/exonuclease/phosphatase family metal-dependent hydrolase